MKYIISILVIVICVTPSMASDSVFSDIKKKSLTGIPDNVGEYTIYFPIMSDSGDYTFIYITYSTISHIIQIAIQDVPISTIIAYDEDRNRYFYIVKSGDYPLGIQEINKSQAQFYAKKLWSEFKGDKNEEDIISNSNRFDTNNP